MPIFEDVPNVTFRVIYDRMETNHAYFSFPIYIYTAYVYNSATGVSRTGSLYASEQISFYTITIGDVEVADANSTDTIVRIPRPSIPNNSGDKAYLFPLPANPIGPEEWPIVPVDPIDPTDPAYEINEEDPTVFVDIGLLELVNSNPAS